MSVALNHTIVPARDKRAAGEFYADLLGLEPPVEYGPFTVLELANGVSLDFVQTEDFGESRHYAFLVSEEEFDAILDRIRERSITFYADPFARRKDEWNTNDGGRGLYWADLDGHWLEILTRPYGSG